MPVYYARCIRVFVYVCSVYVCNMSAWGMGSRNLCRKHTFCNDCEIFGCKILKSMIIIYFIKDSIKSAFFVDNQTSFWIILLNSESAKKRQKDNNFRIIVLNLLLIKKFFEIFDVIDVIDVETLDNWCVWLKRQNITHIIRELGGKPFREGKKNFRQDKE